MTIYDTRSIVGLADQAVQLTISLNDVGFWAVLGRISMWFVMFQGEFSFRRSFAGSPNVENFDSAVYKHLVALRKIKTFEKGDSSTRDIMSTGANDLLEF